MSISGSERISDTTSVYSVTSSYTTKSYISTSSSVFPSGRRRGKRRKKRKGKEGFVVWDPISNVDRTPRPLGSISSTRMPKGGMRIDRSVSRDIQYSGQRSAGSPTQSHISFDSGGASSTMYGSSNLQRRDSLDSISSRVTSTIGPFPNHSTTSEQVSVTLSSGYVDEEEETPYCPQGLQGIGSNIKFPGQKDNEGLDEMQFNQEEIYHQIASQRQQTQEDTGENWKEEDVEELLHSEFPISLSETSTILIFERFQESVSNVDPEIDNVKMNNRNFQRQMERKVKEPHYFSNKGVQTVEVFRKNKYTDKPTKEVETKEVDVKEYEIYDCYEEQRKQRELEEQRLASPIPGSQKKKDGDDDGSDSEDSDDDGLFDDDDEQDDATSSISKLSSGGDVFALNSFYSSLTFVERLVVQNQNESKIREYLSYTKKLKRDRNSKKKINLKKVEGETGSSSSFLTPKREEEVRKRRWSRNFRSGQNQISVGSPIDEGGPSGLGNKSKRVGGEFKTLWRYEAKFIDKMSVNQMCFNPSRYNLFCAIYGDLDVVSREDSQGYILCWNLKNIKYPERCLKIDKLCPVSCGFSNLNPNLLSVGFKEGVVQIYDLRARGSRPVLESLQTHSSAVWDIKWVVDDKKGGGLEYFYTCGSDGRVKRWSISKGLVGTDIMRLRRTGMARGGEDQGGRTSRVLTRECGGMTMDFSREDPNFYLVGTETGSIVKCSTTYNEQYVHVFEGHKGPVYRVKYSPKNPKKFISCSADWTVKLWNEGDFSSSSSSTSREKSATSNNLELTIEPFNNIETSHQFTSTSSAPTINNNGEEPVKQTSSNNLNNLTGGSYVTTKQSFCILDIDYNSLDDSIFAYSSITGEVHCMDSSFSSYTPRIKKRFKSVPSSLLFVPESHVLAVGDVKGRIFMLKPMFEPKNQ